MSVDQQPALYIPHGGGPCFFMEWTMGPLDTWARMAAWLGKLAQQLPRRPSAIVIVSAHWETQETYVTATAQPPLIYDYYGFPEHTYALSYAAPGAPALAAEICRLLHGAQIPAHEDVTRGFDHGVFVPLKVIFPEANIPIVQLSLREDLDAQFHLELGQALAPLREQNILLIGSGMSYHNLPKMMSGHAALEESEVFDRWLNDQCTATRAARDAGLIEWRQAPEALNAHPRAEHLIPLMVAAGAGGQGAGECMFTDNVMGCSISAFSFD